MAIVVIIILLEGVSKLKQVAHLNDKRVSDGSLQHQQPPLLW